MVKRYTTDEVYWAFDHAGANATKFVLASEYDALEDDYEDVITELKSARDALARMKQASDYNAAELARVKAESLRVVEDGEAVDLTYLPVGLRFSVSGQTGVYRRIGSGASAIPEPHSFLIIEDCNSGEEVNVPYGTPVQPVRLERWETANANHD